MISQQPFQPARGIRRYAKPYYRNSNPRVAMEIRDLYFARVYKQVELADLYDLSQSVISRMVCGVTWI